MSTEIQLPDLETLFGSTSFCPCEECGSVLSPAAYLVDVLHSILESKIVAKDAKNIIVNNGVDILFGRRVGKNGEDIPRRPDIENIELTCQNTTTPVPYVDLVNEVLENAVSPLVDWSKPLSNEDRTNLQTRGTAEEVASNPEHINNAAYDVLKQAVYPPTLPLNLPLELARTYLEHLGSSRHQIMQTFQTKGSPSDLAIALEYLKISEEEAAILVGTAPNSLPEFYGYPKSTKTNDLIGHLGQVPEFLNKTSVTFPELIELTRTHFLNPDQAITLHVPNNSDPCNLDNITLTNLDETKLSKIHRFIRLCRKLGWPIHDLDLTLTTTKATDIDRDLLMKLALITRLQTDLRLQLNQLLTFWGKIDTYGDDSLYARLFQNKVVLNPVDKAFALKDDHSDLAAQPPMSEHLDTIVAGLGISAADLVAIRTDAALADTDQDKPELNLTNLSTLYRYTLIGKALGLPVGDLLALLALTGASPFQTADPRPTVEFVLKVRKIRASSFSVPQLNYLYRHQFDPNGNIAPLQSDVDVLVKDLQASLKKITADTTFVPDPTGDLLRQKLGLALDSSLADSAMGLISGTAVFSSGLGLLPKVDFPDPVKSKLSYDETTKQLHFIGAMSETERAQLFGLSADADYRTAITNLFQLPRDFIAAHLTIFLDPKDVEKQIINDPSATKEEKFNYVLTRLMAFLRESLSRGLIKQTLSDALRLDTGLTDLLLETLLKGRTNRKENALQDFLALNNGGLSASYYGTKDLTGGAIQRIDPVVDFDWGAGSPDPAIVPPTFSARWTARIQARYSESHKFYVGASSGVRLWVDGQLCIDQWQNQTTAEFTSGDVALKAGQLYDIKLEYNNTKPSALVKLSWGSPSMTKATIAPEVLYPTGVFASLAVLHKAASLIDTFKMTIQELTYLSAQGTDFANFDLNALPVSPADFDPALFTTWLRLRDLVVLRDSLPKGEVGLLHVFGAGASGSLEEAKAKLAMATSWGTDQVEALAGAAGFNLKASEFKDEIKLIGLQAARTIVKRLGVSAAQLFSWAAAEPEADQADAIKKSVKAKYDDDQWLSVAKPLQDVLREKRRAALVSFLIGNPNKTGQEFRSPNDLFDYFLIDVEMSPCQMTSRIKQAMSSVQLFVQRCLMNLERYPFKDPKGVNVSVDAEGVQWWQWMKNYRVWEANRRIFLYPENWIQTELLPEKSTLFEALENRLLQGDITADSAEDAFREYLGKLDQVARLEAIGLYHQQATQEDLDDVLHVFGRTWSVPQIYFYRRRVKLGGSATWTAWEKVDVDIEGEHLMPVVWNRRLHIFWPIFTEKARGKPLKIDLGKDVPPADMYWEIQLAWSEYKNGKWTPKSLSSGSPLESQGHPAKSEFIFKATVDQENQLTVECIFGNAQVSQQGSPVVREGLFHSNCWGAVVTGKLIQLRPAFLLTETTMNENMMIVGETPDTALSMLAGISAKEEQEEPVLTNAPSPFRLLYPQEEIDQFFSQDSFFYQDDLRTFFVEPEYIPIVEKWHVAASVTPAWGLEPPVFKQMQRRL